MKGNLQISALGNAVFLAVLLAFSHALMKWVAARSHSGYLHSLVDHWLVMTSAIALYVFIFFYYNYILRVIPLSILYPVYTGLSILFVVLVGSLWFEETIGRIQLLGCILITSGVILACFGSR